MSRRPWLKSKPIAFISSSAQRLLLLDGEGCGKRLQRPFRTPPLLRLERLRDEALQEGLQIGEDRAISAVRLPGSYCSIIAS
jgi:hypothetical protein